MLQFYWLEKLANCYGRPFARLGIGQKKRNLANPYQFNVIRIGKSWRIPKDLANPYLANPSFSTIKNRSLANTYILANPSSGELLRSLHENIRAVDFLIFKQFTCDRFFVKLFPSKKFSCILWKNLCHLQSCVPHNEASK